MAGAKGKTGRHSNRSNQWIAGTAERQRTDEVFAFKPKLEVIEAIKTDLEQREISKTEWLDMVVESFLVTREELPGVLNQPLVRDALSIAIASKESALRAEKKSKRPNQALIEKWEAEIKELESFL